MCMCVRVSECFMKTTGLRAEMDKMYYQKIELLQRRSFDNALKLV